jgi:hypothetical protein
MTTRNLVTLVWRTDLLTEAVARRDLSEREQFLLTLFGQIVLFVASYIALFSGIARDWISAAQALVLLAITVFGMSSAFKANGGDHGQDFARRFLIVSIPISVKLSFLSWIAFYAMSWAITMVTLRAADTTFEITMKVFETTWNIVLTSLFFWRLSHWMSVARHQTDGR